MNLESPLFDIFFDIPRLWNQQFYSFLIQFRKFKFVLLALLQSFKSLLLKILPQRELSVCWSMLLKCWTEVSKTYYCNKFVMYAKQQVSPIHWCVVTFCDRPVISWWFITMGYPNHLKIHLNRLSIFWSS